jgi:hypothetical protein
MFGFCSNFIVSFEADSIDEVFICITYVQQLALGMIIPSLELTGWSGHQLQSSIPTVYTTLKLVASKRKASEWSTVADNAAASVQLEDVDVVAATGARGHVQLNDR